MVTSPAFGPPMHVLVLEDDLELGRALELELTREGLKIDWRRDGSSACQAVRQTTFDAVLVDLGLPDMDGLEVVRKIRKDDKLLPIVIVTGRTGVADRIEGLDCGADACLVKPFELVELLARLRAVRRRVASPVQSVLVHGGLAVDLVNHHVSVKGEVVSLQAHEFALLGILMKAPGLIQTAQLREALQLFYDRAQDADVEQCLRALEEKLGCELPTRASPPAQVRRDH